MDAISPTRNNFLVSKISWWRVVNLIQREGTSWGDLSQTSQRV
ncbi:hypothetical protein FDUTEX481_03587 [Tolypothrix sp. PCC 7601]|nr:hypothetical protein FDUTEX481_03587 [Tolypothrix sp. PCC 7601]